MQASSEGARARRGCSAIPRCVDILSCVDARSFATHYYHWKLAMIYTR